MSTNGYDGARSGGKVVYRRRMKFSTSSPYDRPPTPLPPPPESPNWLTGLVFPATRTIVSGAAKLLSSVFTSDSSSSSSSSPSDSNSIDEDGINNDNDQEQDSEFLKENILTSPKVIKCAERDAEQSERMSKSKCLIEQLLMRETFSRAECDRLITLINSRVVDSPTLDYSLRDAMPDRTTVTGTLDPCSQAIIEAREWLKNKKDDLHLVPYSVDRNSGSRSSLTENMEKVDGSPIYVAKSYMKARPPWASPSTEHHTRTPSMKAKLFDEGTPFLDGDDSTPSSRKRNSVASGPWNIYEEIRRVRSKATDDMLHSLPSKKIDLPLSSEQKMKQNAAIDDKVLTTLRDRAYTSGSLAYLSMSSTPSPGTDIGLSEIRQVAGMSVTVPLDLDGLITQEAQDNVRVEMAGESVVSESRQHSGPVPALENVDGPKANATTGSKDISGSKGAQTANVIPSSEASSRGGGSGEHQRMQITTRSRSRNEAQVQVKCELLSEASVEVPNVNEMST